MPDINTNEKWLDMFYRLTSEKEIDRQRSGMSILNKLLELKKSDKDAFLTNVEYTIGRLIRGHMSSSLQTRGYMFTALSSILRVCDGITNEMVMEYIEKNVELEKDDTPNMKQNKSLAAILTCGALLHSRNIKQFNRNTLKHTIECISKYACRKQAFMQYATPFISELFQKINKEYQGKEKTKLCDGIILPAMEPFYEELKKPHNNYVRLQISIASYAAQFGNDYEDFLRDQDTVLEILMANEVLEGSEMELLFQFYDSNNPTAIETFWNIFTANLSATHLNHLCTYIDACRKCFSIIDALNPKILKALYTTMKSGVKEHKTKAEAVLDTVVKWISSSPYILKCPSERGIAIKNLFSGNPNILHCYKEMARVLRLLVSTLQPTELRDLTHLCCEQSISETASTNYTITAINFLTRLAQMKNIETESKTEIVKSILKLSKKEPSFDVKEEPSNSNEESKKDETINDEDDVVISVRNKALISILSFAYNVDFIEEIIKDSEIMDDLTPKEPTSEFDEGVKKAKKLLKSVKKDRQLYYVIGSYYIYLHIDTPAALPVINELVSLCGERQSKSNEKEGAEIVLKVVLNKVLREQQPLLNYQHLFSHLLAKDLIDDDTIKTLAETIDLSTESDSDESDESDKEDEEEAEDDNVEDEDEDVEDIESVNEEENNVNTINRNKVVVEKTDEDSDASMDLDDAPEEELRRMDMILANAARNRGKDEMEKELRYTMRVKNLLKVVIKRKKSTPLAETLKKQIKLV